METLILICLILIIILLSMDKVKFIFEKKDVPHSSDRVSKTNDIMGQPKSSTRLDKLSENRVVISETRITKPEDLNSEAGSDQVDEIEVDFDVEEAEWREHSYVADQANFAAGVTFEELQAFSDYINKDSLGSNHEQQILETAKKLQGTELFSLLENSLEGASKKIAQLLDKTFDSADLNENDQHNSFDINNYI